MTIPAVESNSHAATLQHIALLRDQRQRLDEKRRKLDEIQAEAEIQLAHRVACDHAAGLVSDRDVYEVYQRLRAVGSSGFGRRWNAAMPRRLRSQVIVWTAVRSAPDSDGIWRGEFPFDAEARTPPNFTSVVYVLFDAANRPCYVGSSEKFRTRMKAHHRDGKQFTRWMAYPCADREAAYALEERLLAEHQPYLNRKASR